MTTLKTGDRVVPGRFESTIDCTWIDCMEEYIGKELIIHSVDSCGTCKITVPSGFYYWPEHALTPVKPKWEPVVGERYRKINGRIIKRYIGYDTELEAHVFYNEDSLGYESCNIEFLRPIAPSPEEELRNELNNKLADFGLSNSWDITFQLLPIIAEWHNRHKEGEGR